MTLTILASVSLLALVSSARPLPKLDSDDGWNALQLCVCFFSAGLPPLD